MTLTRNGVGFVTASLTFILLTIVFSLQAHSWINGLRFSQFGRVTQATVIDAHPKCLLAYNAGDYNSSYDVKVDVEDGCDFEIGQKVPVTYLPGSSVASLKPPGAQWMFQLGAIVTLSIFAGIIAAWYATKKDYAVRLEGVFGLRKLPWPSYGFKLRNLSWSSIAVYASRGAFGCMLAGLAGIFTLGSTFFNFSKFLMFVGPVLAAAFIIMWLSAAILTVALEGQGRKLIPSLGFVLFTVLGAGIYLLMVYAISQIDQAAARRHHGSQHHFQPHHHNDGAPPANSGW
jgi:hypothetical protein